MRLSKLTAIKWGLVLVALLGLACAYGVATVSNPDIEIDVELVRTLHSDRVVDSVAFSPDGDLLATSSSSWEKGQVSLWRVATGEKVRVIADHNRTLISVAFSPDGDLLATSSNSSEKGGRVSLWRVATGEKLHVISGHNRYVTSVAFSPDGHLLATASTGALINLWEVNTGLAIRTLVGQKDPITSVAFSPDGDLLASGLERTFSDETIKHWEVASGEEVRALAAHDDDVESVAFSPDGRLLASGSADSTVKLWKAATGDAMRTLRGHNDGVEAVAFSPDGQLLASGGWDNRVKLWDVTTGEKIRTLDSHSDDVTSVAFSPEGQMLASGSEDDTIKLWQIQRMENQPPRAGFSVSPSRPGVDQSVRFDASASADPDGEIIDYAWAFGDGTTGSGEMVTHTYDTSGTYDAKLTVTDDDGATDAASRTVQVEAEPAFFALSELNVSPSSPDVDEEVAISASVRNTGGQEASRSIRLLVDGSAEDRQEVRLDAEAEETVRFRHSFASGGRHTVALRSDNDRIARQVDVAEPNEPPIPQFSYAPTEPVQGNAVSFDAAESTDPDGEIVEYAWDFGDGATAEGKTAEHTFAEAGTYTVKLTLTDDEGASATLEKEIEVLESGGSGGPA